jgi:hypothetical protein
LKIPKGNEKPSIKEGQTMQWPTEEEETIQWPTEEEQTINNL